MKSKRNQDLYANIKTYWTLFQCSNEIKIKTIVCYSATVVTRASGDLASCGGSGGSGIRLRRWGSGEGLEAVCCGGVGLQAAASAREE